VRLRTDTNQPARSSSVSHVNVWDRLRNYNQSINQSKYLINSCQTATEHIHMNRTNKNNDKMQ